MCEIVLPQELATKCAIYNLTAVHGFGLCQEMISTNEEITNYANPVIKLETLEITFAIIRISDDLLCISAIYSIRKGFKKFNANLKDPPSSVSVAFAV